MPPLADYQRLERLAPGPRSEVWLAKAPDGERVALKIVLPEVARRQSFQTIFEKETSPVLAMSHPNVLRCRDRGTDGRVYFVAQEWGASSLRVLLRAGRLAPNVAIGLAVDVCGALDYAHRRAIVHRHLVAENVFVTPGRPTRVSDFGWSLLDGPPPAQARTNPRSDLHELAALLHLALSGTSTRPQHETKARSGDPLSARFDDFFARALSADPAARFARASEMSLALSLLSPSKAGAPDAAAAPSAVSLDTRACSATLRIGKEATASDVEAALRKLESRVATGSKWQLAYDLTELSLLEEALKNVIAKFHEQHPAIVSRVAFASPRAMVRAGALVIAQRQLAPWKLFAALDPMFSWLKKEDA